MTRRYARFYPETIQFLEQLTANNNREWFQEHKGRYEEQVLDVALAFIQSMQDPLADIAPHFVAVPTRVGGSLMRVYRDTRFSKNKTPYKTNIGIQFRHERAKDVHSPGYYLHIALDQVFVGVGMWRPDADPLRRIRDRIAARPSEWKRVLSDRSFKRQFQLGGESLVRPPRGFDKSHECIDDIRRKSFIAVKELEVDEVFKPQFQRTVESSFKVAESFMRFLCTAVGVKF
ncbi:MAG: TIGR02453 family protein [Gammaproteobacteria bacterium]|nr:TIGR02453 family protein [Gammaproteobacteria bacterium]